MTPNEVLIVLALLVQVLLTLTIYIVLYRVRAAAVRRGDAKLSTYIVPRDEPRDVARVSRSLANQYELPVLFYVLVLSLLAIGAVTLVDVALAWVFVIARLVHAWVHITREDVLLRGKVFGIGVVVVLLLALRVAWVALAAS